MATVDLIDDIHNEDCLTTMSHMDAASIDLVVTSPPYDGIRKYGGFVFDYLATINALYRVVAVGGVVVWVVADQCVNGSESGSSFRQALAFKDAGFNIHDTMIYRKVNPVPLNHNRYEQAFEYMFVMSKGKPKTFNPVMVPCIQAGRKDPRSTFYNNNSSDVTSRRPTRGAVADTKIKHNVWDIINTSGYKGHPAPFPEQLALDHVLSWSNPGDIVYDPFMGSGTTAKVCVDSGRRFIGSEISADYCALAWRRLGDVYDAKGG